MSEIKKKKSFSERLRKSTRMRSPLNTSRSQEMSEASLMASEDIKSRVADLFAPITREFERLYTDNISLREKVSELHEKLKVERCGSVDPDVTMLVPEEQGGMQKQKLVANKDRTVPSSCALGGSQFSRRIKTTYRVGTSKVERTMHFKNSANLDCTIMRDYGGHGDGVWDVDCVRFGQPIIGTASADRKARIWCAETGNCLLEYSEHTGSVNSIRFHPQQLLACTGALCQCQQPVRLCSVLLCMFNALQLLVTLLSMSGSFQSQIRLL
eukprot:m.65013 g.65013  ORF g.65013 m.65013 type:complete len:269 (+) comp35289_c0_seq4:36-842(+)